MDWGAGSYERTAALIEPASRAVVEAAGVEAGERVLDVACGTGNAALAAAARGARVTGLDSAPRLLEVARGRQGGEDVEWVEGGAESLPFEDDAFDAVLSVFGVIFARDARRAAAELERVVRPGGRIVVTSWIDRGPLAEVMRASRAAAPPPPPSDTPEGPAPSPMNWGDPAALRDLLAGALTTEEHAITFTAASPRAYVEEQFAHHPGWVGLRAALPDDRVAALAAELEGILAAGNQDPDGLRIESPYLVVRVQR